MKRELNRADFAAVLLIVGAVVGLAAVGVMAQAAIQGDAEGEQALIGVSIVALLAVPIALISLIVAVRLFRRRFEGWIGAIFLFAVLGWVAPGGPVIGLLGLWALLTQPGREAFGVRSDPGDLAG